MPGTTTVDPPTTLREPTEVPQSAFTLGDLCSWGDVSYRVDTVTGVNCLIHSVSYQGPRLIDINVPAEVKAVRGALVLADDSRPRTFRLFVAAFADELALPVGEVTFAQDYTFDIPTVSGERRISFEVSQPEDAVFGDFGHFVFIGLVFVY